MLTYYRPPTKDELIICRLTHLIRKHKYPKQPPRRSYFSETARSGTLCEQLLIATNKHIVTSYKHNVLRITCSFLNHRTEANGLKNLLNELVS